MLLVHKSSKGEWQKKKKKLNWTTLWLHLYVIKKGYVGNLKFTLSSVERKKKGIMFRRDDVISIENEIHEELQQKRKGAKSN